MRHLIAAHMIYSRLFSCTISGLRLRLCHPSKLYPDSLVSSRRMRQFSFNSLKYFVIAPCRREYVDTFTSLYLSLSLLLSLPLSLYLPAYIESLLLSPLSIRQICLIFSMKATMQCLQWNCFAYDERGSSTVAKLPLGWLIPYQKWLRREHYEAQKSMRNHCCSCKSSHNSQCAQCDSINEFFFSN